MKKIIYSVMFAGAFYLMAVVVQMMGMEDNAKTGIYILCGVLAVLGVYIAIRNRGQ
ncbi:MAG: hypothetical protein IKS51_03725 [Erysipelotrichaceae bacterium]|nr:hypothetical protein [Erysipelotrichaceae bacterium]